MEVFNPNEDPSGSVSVGWTRETQSWRTPRVDITVRNLGDDERSETRVDATLDRAF